MRFFKRRRRHVMYLGSPATSVCQEPNRLPDFVELEQVSAMPCRGWRRAINRSAMILRGSNGVS